MLNNSYFNRLSPLTEDILSKKLKQYDLSPIFVGHFKTHIPQSIINTSLPCHRLIYITNGPIYYTIYGTTLLLEEGDVLYTPPNTIYSATSAQPDILPEFLYLYFKVLPFYQEKEFIRMMETSGKIRVFHALLSPVESYFRTILKEYEKRNAGYYHKIHSYFMLLVMELLQRKGFAGEIPLSHKNSSHNTILLNKATSYIAANIKDPLRISQVSHACGVSESYLYRIFSSGLGLSPKEYILNCKMEYAMKLLEKKDMTITQIARELGFSNPNHFSNAFFKITGIRPSQYKNPFSETSTITL